MLSTPFGNINICFDSQLVQNIKIAKSTKNNEVQTWFASDPFIHK